VLSKIADFTDNIPSTSLKYTYFAGVQIAGNLVTFFGSSYDQANPPAKPAILFYDLSNGTTKVAASWQTQIPDRNQTFFSFSGPGIDFDGLYLTFVAQGSVDYWGVAKYSIQTGELWNVADEQTPAPGLNNKFTGFQGPPCVNSDGKVAFRIVHEPDPMTGIWLATLNGLKKHDIIRVVGVTSVLPGIGTVERMGYGENAYHEKTITFPATVRNSGLSRAGVYRATLPASLFDQTQNEKESDKQEKAFFETE